MALVINSNIASLATQRSLAETQKDSATSLERLSSGLRINSAKDDAAGVAIANRFSAQINGLSAAMRNANDGISMLQTMDSALSEMTDNLQRMRELAVQAANGTNLTADRTALDAELQQLILEIDRVADGTKFNGNNLFTTAITSVDIQVGADNSTTDATNKVNIGSSSLIDARTSALGTTGTTSITTTLAPAITVTGLGATDLVINGTAVAAAAKGGNGSYAANLAAAVENADSDITATVGSSTLTMTELGAFVTEGTATTLTSSINGIVLIDGLDTSSTNVTAAYMDARIDSKQSELAAAGITYTGSVAGGDIVFTRADGGNINFVNSDGAGTAASNTGGFANALFKDGSASGYGDVVLTSTYEFVIEAGAGTIGNAGTSAATITAGTPAGTALASISVTSTTNAATALTSIDSALNTVNVARSNIGANHARLDSVSSNLASVVENYTSARSRVMDADFAVESANLARTQVLQQAGISVLAQANAMPQQVLALLQ